MVGQIIILLQCDTKIHKCVHHNQSAQESLSIEIFSGGSTSQGAEIQQLNVLFTLGKRNF